MTDTSPPLRREWRKVTHRSGGTFVTVTLSEPGFTAKWTTKTYATHLKAGYREAREHAERALRELQEVVAEVDAEQEKAA